VKGKIEDFGPEILDMNHLEVNLTHYQHHFTDLLFYSIQVCFYVSMFPLIFAFLAFFCEFSAELVQYILCKLWDKISSTFRPRIRHEIIQVRPVRYEKKKSKREKLSSAFRSLCKAAKAIIKKKRPKTPRSRRPVRLKLSAHRASPTRLNKLETNIRTFCRESKEKFSNKTILKTFLEDKFPVLATFSVQGLIEKVVEMRQRSEADDRKLQTNDPKLKRF
jgi:hypothetical protein